MRTRIALVAIVPVAVITISTLTLAVSDQPARALTASSGGSGTAVVAIPPDQLIAYQEIAAPSPTTGASTLLLLADGALGAFVPGAARTVPVPPIVAAPPPVAAPVDTVTPAQRAAWERVAMCEEGGNWAADGGSFSGGLGITRSNWYAYGGGAYAPSGAQATEDQQIMVAERIQSSPPDQYGCGSW